MQIEVIGVFNRRYERKFVMWKSCVIVGCGGAIGSVARYSVSILMPMTFPLSTVVVNIVGCFILGYLTSLFSKNRMSPLFILFLGTGFCGGFTTFSTFASETVFLLQTSVPMAFAYVMLSGALGIGASFVGIKLGNRN